MNHSKREGMRSTDEVGSGNGIPAWCRSCASLIILEPQVYSTADGERMLVVLCGLERRRRPYAEISDGNARVPPSTTGGRHTRA